MLFGKCDLLLAQVLVTPKADKGSVPLGQGSQDRFKLLTEGV